MALTATVNSACGTTDDIDGLGLRRRVVYPDAGLPTPTPAGVIRHRPEGTRDGCCGGIDPLFAFPVPRLPRALSPSLESTIDRVTRIRPEDVDAGVADVGQPAELIGQC